MSTYIILCDMAKKRDLGLYIVLLLIFMYLAIHIAIEIIKSI